MEALSAVLSDPSIAKISTDNFSEDELLALTLLAEQTVRMGIDYATLKLGWDHPESRTEYRDALSRSATCPASRKRQSESKRCLLEMIKLIADGKAQARTAIPLAFMNEIGVGSPSYEPLFQGVLRALENELVLPLRALNEGQESMTRTFNGQPVPADPIARAVSDITKNVVQGTYKEWRYNNPVGQQQLKGLSDQQIALWAESSSLQQGAVRTHEDQNDELGLFWATKIGGPSHGFDIE
eukprot:gene10721-12683_t